MEKNLKYIHIYLNNLALHLKLTHCKSAVLQKKKKKKISFEEGERDRFRPSQQNV